MKINNITTTGANPVTKRSQSPAKATQAPSISSGEQVALSSLSARLQEAGAAMADVPVVDAARVAEIKGAISEGRFQVNPERIAAGLLENVRQMLAKQR